MTEADGLGSRDRATLAAFAQRLGLAFQDEVAGGGACLRFEATDGAVTALAIRHAGLGDAARPVAALLGLGVTALALRRFRDPVRVALWVGGGFVLLSPTVHPWYLLWAWVPALLAGVRAWTVLAVLAPVSYAVFIGGGWTERAWPALVQYLPFGAALAWEAWRHLVTPGPWAPGPAPSERAA